jgi:hypothetical protein
LVAIAALTLVAAIKIVIGLARNRPVSFLVMSAIGFAVLTFYVIKGRRTVRGDRILDDLKVLFDSLRHRSSELRPNASSSELALLMAVFGLGAVPPTFPFVRVFRPDPSSSSSCGSSGKLAVAAARRGERWLAALWEASVDRFGVTWQPGLAAGILAHLDRIVSWGDR